MTNLLSTADRVLAALRPYGLAQDASGEYRCTRSPLRMDRMSDSNAFTLTITGPENGAYFDHVTGESGSLYDLAKILKLANHPNGSMQPEDPQTYPDRHGATWADFNRWGAALQPYVDLGDGTTYDAIFFNDASGGKYRLFGHKAKFKPASKGQLPCWYGLREAVQLANATGLDTLYLVNGQSSVIACHAHGIPAFTIPGGEGNIAGRLQKDLLPELKIAWSKTIRVVLDGDKTGYDSAPKVVDVLATIYSDVEALDPGTGNDAADLCVWNNSSSAQIFESLPTIYPLPAAGTQKQTTTSSTTHKPSAAPVGSISQQIIAQLAALGYTFRLNDCDDSIEVNGQPIDDIMRAELRMVARDHHIEPLPALQDAYTTEAARHRYHPIHEYLNGLTWDRADHIGQLVARLQSSDTAVRYPDGTTTPLHAVYLQRWLVGAVAKALDRQQNLLLVLAGPQGIGKSAFVRWLCSGLPKLFIEAPINPNDKDSDVRLMGRFIWEVSELDATTRRADVAAIKAFITKDQVVVRKPYGHDDTIKPAIASFIGTLNETTGFLSDESGSRRFMVTTLTEIDWSYTDLDINQIWAQAVALYRRGEPWRLLPCEVIRQQETNRHHEVESILEGWIQKYFLIGSHIKSRMTSADIVEHLQCFDIRLSGSTTAQSMELSRVLTRLGAQKKRTNSWRGYLGIMPRVNPVSASSDDLDDEVDTRNNASGSRGDNLDNLDNHSTHDHQDGHPVRAVASLDGLDVSIEKRSSQVVTNTGQEHHNAIEAGDTPTSEGCHEAVTDAKGVTNETESESRPICLPEDRQTTAGLNVDDHAKESRIQALFSAQLYNQAIGEAKKLHDDTRRIAWLTKLTSITNEEEFIATARADDDN